MEGRVNFRGDVDAVGRELAPWAEAGASHVSVNTMGAGLKSVDDHLDALAAVAESLPVAVGGADPRSEGLVMGDTGP